MEKIINDLGVALDKMNTKADEFAKKSAELDFLIADSKKQKADLDKRDEFILAKEAKYAEYDTVENLRAEIKAEKVAIAKEKSALSAEKKEIENAKIAIDNDRKKVDNLVALYKAKSNDCDVAMQKLAEDRKNLQKSILEEMTKKLSK